VLRQPRAEKRVPRVGKGGGTTLPIRARYQEAGITVAVAGAIFALGYYHGGFGTEARGAAGLLVWWAVVLALVLGWHPQRWFRAAAAATIALAALGILTIASMAWASSDERVFAEFTRVALYVGVLLLVLTVARAESAARWSDGIAMGITALALLALFSRCFPQVIDTTSAFRFLPYGRTRLSYPVGYWNGLGVLVAIGVPLALRAALSASSRAARSLAVAALPPLGVVIYLTSSRTGIIALAVGLVVLVAIPGRRAAILGILAFVAVALVADLAVVVPRKALVDGPFDTAAARHQGWIAALAIVGISTVVALLYPLLCRVAGAHLHPTPRSERALLLGIAIVVVAALLLSHPVRRFREFKAPPAPSALTAGPGYAQSHLLSISGNGRWLMWTAAVHEFEHHWLLGDGAGSFGQWWQRTRPYGLAAQDAHSLYLEMLGELGIPGLLLLLVVLGAGFLAGARRLRMADEESRGTAAALLAALSAVAVGALGDWVWELPVVGAVAVAIVALLVGPATARSRTAVPAPRRVSLVFTTAVVVAAALVGACFFVAAYADLQLQRSRAAFSRGDLRAASLFASRAREVEPWAATPSVQLALVAERAGDLSRALANAERATRMDPHEWTLWLVRARIETKLGAIGSARRSLAKAREVNPLCSCGG
jgi:O-Antigen ligase